MKLILIIHTCVYYYTLCMYVKTVSQYHVLSTTVVPHIHTHNFQTHTHTHNVTATRARARAHAHTHNATATHARAHTACHRALTHDATVSHTCTHREMNVGAGGARGEPEVRGSEREVWEQEESASARGRGSVCVWYIHMLLTRRIHIYTMHIQHTHTHVDTQHKHATHHRHTHTYTRATLHTRDMHHTYTCIIPIHIHTLLTISMPYTIHMYMHKQYINCHNYQQRMRGERASWFLDYSLQPYPVTWVVLGLIGVEKAYYYTVSKIL